MPLRDMTIDEAQNHAANLIRETYTGGEIWKRARELLPSYYVTWRQGKKRTGWCSACYDTTLVSDSPTASASKYATYTFNDDETDTAGFYPPSPYANLQNAYIRSSERRGTGIGRLCICPTCRRVSTVKIAGRGASSSEQFAHLFVWGKSAVDPNIVVCLGVSVMVSLWPMMYDENVGEQCVLAEPDCIAVFQSGVGAWKFQRWVWLSLRPSRYANPYFCLDFNQCHDSDWRRVKAVTGSATHPMTRHYLDVRSFDEAVQGTPFGWVTDCIMDSDAVWYEYNRIGTMNMIAKHPDIQHLYLHGFNNLATAIIRGQFAVRWQAKSLHKALGISKKRMDQILSMDLNATPPLLRAIRWADTEHPEAGLRSISLISWVAETTMADFHILTLMADFAASSPYPLDTYAKYCRRQRTRFGDYLDYIGQLRTLQITQDRATLFPTNFGLKHAELETRIIILRDVEIDKRIAEVRGLYQERFTWHYRGWELKMIPDAASVEREGELQHHCVGRYAQKYSEGRTILCTLRSMRLPDTPMYTVEFLPEGRMVQCRGAYNDTPNKEHARRIRDNHMIDEFFDSFNRHLERIRLQRHDPEESGCLELGPDDFDMTRADFAWDRVENTRTENETREREGDAVA